MDFRFSPPSLVIVFTFALIGILNVSPADARPLDHLEKSAVDERLLEMQHQPLTEPVDERLVDYDNDCWYATADIPVMDPNENKKRILRVHIVRPVSRKPTPVVVVVPTIEGHTVLENRMANSLCEHGMAAIIADVNNPNTALTPPGWGLEDRNFKWAIHALRTVVDFAEAHPQFDRDRIGALGGSLGGITVGFLAGVENRLKAMMIAAGGGNLPSILAYGDYRKVNSWRDQRMKSVGLSSPAEYENILREKIRHDPLYFADRVDTGRVMMVLVRGDDAVLEENQVEYWRAIRNPQAIWMRYGHLVSLIRVGYLAMDDASSFFLDRFASVAR